MFDGTESVATFPR